MRDMFKGGRRHTPLLGRRAGGCWLSLFQHKEVRMEPDYVLTSVRGDEKFEVRMTSVQLNIFMLAVAGYQLGPEERCEVRGVYNKILRWRTK
jgi:hypothetical protein